MTNVEKKINIGKINYFCDFNFNNRIYETVSQIYISNVFIM